jgi:hypothetical protein
MPEPADQKTALLEALDCARVPATQAPFIVRDQFRNASGVRFSTVWNEFKKRFFDKVEGPAAELRLRRHRLLTLAPDGPIIAELGGAARVESSVAAVFALIRRQASGEDGFLQTNGYANIFYVRDEKGGLCAVRVGWDGEGWVVDAISVEDPLAWNGKHEIFCPVPEMGAQ